MAGASHNEFDFAVIGGGLVGAAIAWGLARRGRSVAMLDEGDIAFRASRGNFALIWVQSKGGGMSRYALWTRQSSDAWPRLAEAIRIETGLDVCLHQLGGFHLLLAQKEMENRANALKRLHNQPGMVPFEYRMLDHAQTQKMLPQVGPDVVGASFCPLDGHVNALRLLRALHVGFQLHGGRYFPDRAVERIEPRGGEFRLRGGNVEISAHKIVYVPIDRYAFRAHFPRAKESSTPAGGDRASARDDDGDAWRLQRVVLAVIAARGACARASGPDPT